MGTPIIKVKAGRCPKCNCWLSYVSELVEHGYYSRAVECETCDFEGREWYDLVFVGFSDKAGKVFNI